MCFGALEQPWQSLQAPIGSLADKLRVGWMRARLQGRSLGAIPGAPGLFH